MIFSQNNSTFNKLYNYNSMNPEFSTDYESIEDFNFINELSYTYPMPKPDLDNNIFLEKKRLQKEKSLYDDQFINKIYTEEHFSDIKEIFLEEIKLDSDWEITSEKTKENSSNKLFETKKIKNRGRRTQNLINENIIARKAHNKYSFDNIITKIQAHYINFVINLANDIIKTVFGVKKDNKTLCFKNIEYKSKIYSNYDKFQILKEGCIKDILIKPASKKNNSIQDNYNGEIYNKLINSSEILDEYFNKEYLSLFEFYYNNGQELKSINIKDKNIELSDKTKSFFSLINKNQNNNCKMKNLMIECINKVFLPKENESSIIENDDSKKNLFNIIK